MLDPARRKSVRNATLVLVILVFIRSWYGATISAIMRSTSWMHTRLRLITLRFIFFYFWHPEL